MKIFIAGATGRVGEALIKNLVAKGHFIYAGARHEETLQANNTVKPVHLDLHGSIDQIAETLSDAEAVYFVAGSRGKDLLQTDLYGAVKLMQAVERQGIKRYIHLSSLFAMQPEKWSTALTDYNIAKFFSDHWLMDKTSLDYTILQPGSLKESPGSGKITTDITQTSENSIENVATVLADLLERQNTIKKVILMGDGDEPIANALKKI
ncbi:NAD(P)H-binding protein [Enterococcus pseudoavium]|uniref:NAD(P)H-binding protein n=1 Tax=Enterococcus pseudoavium TaxID=44007 RepID=A0ABU3FLL5_9ENTE|nr:NAD(P)H-binding protein [Enterococcus pseudoavium]MDT2755000.1 NAD(P)H-binding protein [Enterococcus pseudoavium]MDT2770919.1 NAD(P)H-binding protein [Enterococcus pseudoavium]